MPTEDRSAFVETLEVPTDRRILAELELRSARAELDCRRLEYEIMLLNLTVGRSNGVNHHSAESLTRTADGQVHRAWWRRAQSPKAKSSDDAARKEIARLRRRLEAMHADVGRLEQETREARADRRPITICRLHSEDHHVDLSQERFVRWSITQRSVPVLAHSKAGKRWWWYRDRFWWDRDGLKAREIRVRVDELDSRSHDQSIDAERIRSAVLDDASVVVADPVLDEWLETGLRRPR
jgi:hypothetical protein